MYVQYLDEQNINSIFHFYPNKKIDMRQRHAYTSDDCRQFADARQAFVRFNLHRSAHNAQRISLYPHIVTLILLNKVSTPATYISRSSRRIRPWAGVYRPFC